MNKVIIYNDLNQYIAAYHRWLNAPATITTHGKMFIEGVPAKEWKAHNPKPVYEQPVYENPDGTRVGGGVVVQNKKRDARFQKK